VLRRSSLRADESDNPNVVLGDFGRRRVVVGRIRSLDHLPRAIDQVQVKGVDPGAALVGEPFTEGPCILSLTCNGG
jgi:hypothetical protein